jgi:hypothetical protein
LRCCNTDNKYYMVYQNKMQAFFYARRPLPAAFIQELDRPAT